MEADLQAVRDVVKGTTLSDEVRHSMDWCLGQLPRLYKEFLQTYDNRFSGEITRILQGMLQKLTGQGKVAEAVTAQLNAMHERLGIPGITLKTATRSKKAG